MNTQQVEKVLGKPFDPSVSLKEQCTPAQWAQICFESDLEVQILSEKSKRGGKTEKHLKDQYKKLLDKHNGNYEKAVNELG